MSSGSAQSSAIRVFRAFAWTVLGVTILVIIWGAVVRATGSGAGCGNHWPLCNGEVLPLAPRAATIIEFGHRVSSGIIMVMMVVLVAAAFRVFPRGHTARRAALWSLVFVLVEAAVGAGIVLMKLVEQNASALRAGNIALHLVNTMLLVGAVTATVYAAGSATVEWPREVRRRIARQLLIGLGLMLVVGAAGAVVALGDTLFPHETLAAGIVADFSPASSFLVRLRIWHPLFAVATSLYLVTVVARSDAFDEPALRTPARLAMFFIAGQLALGIVNVLQMAPLALQLAHLLLSNLLWITLVWMWRALEAR